MNENFRLVMIGAMYENGGNLLHRLLDGHPQLFVYPFESQLGTAAVNDPLASLFPKKYRWPAFALDADPTQDYHAIIDEECKVRARTPHVSKFRHVDFEFSDDERRASYVRYVEQTGRSRANNVAAFLRATFDCWKNRRSTGEETCYVGYSPIVAVDTEKILSDFPQAHVVHVVRNPWSAYADTKKRPMPLALREYMLGWVVNQYFALLFQKRFPGRVHVLRTEDVMADSLAALHPLCVSLQLRVTDSLKTPSWNGTPQSEVYPWGTIRRATADVNRATAAELSPGEREEIRAAAWQYLEVFNYSSFV